MADDFSSDIFTTGRIEVGGTATGVIDFDPDADWFATTLTGGATYRIDLRGMSAGGTLVDPFLSGVYAADGTYLGYSDDDGGDGQDSRTFFTASETATYFIAAAGYHNNTGSYELSLSEVVDDFPNDPTTTGMLPVHGTAEGVIDFWDDRDWFAVALEPGTIYGFSTNIPDIPYYYYQVPRITGVFDAEGAAAPQLTNYWDGAVVMGLLSDAGTYFVEVGEGRIGEPYTLRADALYRLTDAERAAVGDGRSLNVEPGGNNYDSQVVGAGGRDLLVGMNGNDTLQGREDADFLLGGAGNDVLLGEENFTFGYDGIRYAAGVYRLYHLLLDRAPDPTGWSFWSDRAYDEWMSNVTHGLLDSPEFISRFGELDTEAFVDMLYTRMRGPEGAGDDPGRALWIARIEDHGWGRSYVATAFAQSDEMKARTGDTWLAHLLRAAEEDASDEVYSAYDILFDRTPDLEGFVHWVRAMGDGLDLEGLAGLLLQSAEFVENGDLDDRAFVTLVLTNAAGAAPDAAEVDRGAALLSVGVSRAEYAASHVLLHDGAGLADWMRRKGGGDVLVGGDGDDLLYGGMLSDKFVFRPQDAGIDTILRFEPWDRLDFTEFGYADVAEARGHFRQNGGTAVFQDGDVTVQIRDFDVTMLEDEMILV